MRDAAWVAAELGASTPRSSSSSCSKPRPRRCEPRAAACVRRAKSYTSVIASLPNTYRHRRWPAPNRSTRTNAVRRAWRVRLSCAVLGLPRPDAAVLDLLVGLHKERLTNVEGAVRLLQPRTTARQAFTCGFDDPLWSGLVFHEQRGAPRRVPRGRPWCMLGALVCASQIVIRIAGNAFVGCGVSKGEWAITLE